MPRGRARRLRPEGPEGRIPRAPAASRPPGGGGAGPRGDPDAAPPPAAEPEVEPGAREQRARRSQGRVDRPQAAVSERGFLRTGLGGGGSSAGCPGCRQPRNGKEAAVAAVSPLFRSRFRGRRGGAGRRWAPRGGLWALRGRSPRGKVGLRGVRGTWGPEGGRGPQSECRVPGPLGGRG